MMEGLTTRDLSELEGLARARRDLLYADLVTFSPKVFVPVTRLCNDRCGYCTFVRTPRSVGSAFLERDEVLAICAAGREAGCHEALLTLGERPEARWPEAARWLADRGYGSTVDYLVDICRAIVEECDLLPHVNAGALTAEELALLQPVSVSQGMMLESTAELACHRGAPDKAPARRLATLQAAGALGIPFTTGVLVGIGETREDRLATLEAIADAHRRFGHVAEVIVQNFLPKPGTPMAHWPPCPEEEHRWTIAAARLVLPDDVHVQAPPNLASGLSSLLDAGVDDLGGISPVTPDHVNPERPWPELDRLAGEVEAHGRHLVARLPIYPEDVQQLERWVPEGLRRAVVRHSDAHGLARDHRWAPGLEVPPPRLVDDPLLGTGAFPTGPAPLAWPPGLALGTRSRRLGRGPVEEVIDGVRLGQVPGEAELVTLFGARGSSLVSVLELADELREEAVGPRVTWVANRNINYTNVCTFRCRFCAFSKGPRSLNLRGTPYLLSLEEIAGKVVEAKAAGATEVCLQGGIHPSFDGEFYLRVIEAVKAAAPDIHVHGFSALEVTEGARRLREPLDSYLSRLRDAGLRTLPGTAAEILDDEVRARLCPDKVTTEEWLEAHRVAHRVGLRSNVTIMAGSIERPIHLARHLLRTAALQRETGGFTEFVPLPFVHMGAPIYLDGRARSGPTFREVLLVHAIGRIAYRGLIPSVQASWVKLGLAGVRQLLQAGANDLGGTLMEENISRAAGASHGQSMGPEEFAGVVQGLGRTLEQRTTLYESVLAHA
jgi:FO synthase